jgi:CP family cyanate transporter-like MFS transporter
VIPDGPAPSADGRHGRLLVGAAIVLLALNLRVAVGSVGVVLDALQDDLGMSASVAGILTTLPVLCFALVGGSSPWIVRAIGLHRTTVLLLAVTATGLVSRAVVDTSAAFLLLSILALAGSAVGNVILPALAKVHFPDRIPLISSLFGAALMTGAALGSIATVPLADAYSAVDRGGWRFGIGVWAVLAVVTIVPWLRFVGHDLMVDRGSSTFTMRQLTRSRIAWATALCFGAQSAQAYAQFGWFPAILHDGGLSSGTAGAMQALLSAVGIPMTLALPVLIRWAGPRPVLPWLFATVTMAGWAGVLAAPASLPWLWAVLLGIGGCAFTWTLTMIGRRARTPEGTAALSGFAQSVGYVLAGLGPLGTGLVHDATGTWTVPVAVLLVSGLLIGVFGSIVNRGAVLEDELRN